MAQPQWITPAGDLGTIAEGLFFSVPILAVDPDGGTVNYRLIAGNLPAGIQVKPNGVIDGVPSAASIVQGVPSEVGENITSRFVVRAFTQNINSTVIRFADRTFSMTVTGQDIPRFVTPPGRIGTFYDGTAAEMQINFTDSDPDDTVTISVLSGELPPGLTLNRRTGLISGVILPLVGPPGTAQAGYDSTQYDQFPFDFPTQAASKNYQFTLAITDGKDMNLRTFEIYVYAKSTMQASTTDITADDTFVTADVTPDHLPVLLTPQGNLGTYRHSNFFAFQFQAIDFDGDPIEFGIVGGNSADLPPGLVFDVDTGWLYGYLPDQGATEETYNFQVFVFKKNDTQMVSAPKSYSLQTVGDIENAITWRTPENVGTIDNGAVSLFAIEAFNAREQVLLYRLTPGGNNKLPQGLSLLENGLISGRVSFDTFALDNGTTTFDQRRTTRLNVRPTTFDLQFNFTVEVYSADGLISVTRRFSITVNREYNEPYESLYIQAMPGDGDRTLLDSLLQNQDIIRPSFLFRPDDPYFGRAQRITYQHAFGLKTAVLDEYVEAMNLNHYWKQLVLGELKVAQARDPVTEQVIYEVVYSEVQDSGVNTQGESPPQAVPTAFPVILTTGGTVNEVYPNSLIQMRDQIVDTVGQFAEVLPLWMTSKQANGRVLGFVRGVVIAYCVPGRGEQLLYNINTQWPNRLNQIDFNVDRYTLDRQYSRNWIPDSDNPEGGNWIPAESTTFDYEPHFVFPQSALSGGTGYAVGDRIRILGSQVGGENQFNDVIITVAGVNNNGTIETAFCSGVAPGLAANGTIYNDIAGTNITGTGTGATFDLQVNITTNPTVFDGNSLLFTSPSDQYGLTDEYNKYLLFPKVNILYEAPEPPPPPPQLTGA